MEYKINLTIEQSNNLYIMRLMSASRLRRVGNSERFTKALCGEREYTWALITQDTHRVYSTFNPHLAQALNEARVDGWKIDNLGECYDNGARDIELTSFIDIAATYSINFETGTIKRKKLRNERVCKNCGRLTTTEHICGYYCDRCLTTGCGALAYRCGYHNQPERFIIREQVNEAITPVFGAEIERDYLSTRYGTFSADLKAAMLGAVKAYYGNKLKTPVDREHIFESDSSLTENGIEWVTYPATYSYFKKQRKAYNQALEIMKKNNFGASEKAGNHIHINRKFFGANSDLAGAKIAILINKHWEAFKAIAKRERTGYCQKPAQNDEQSEWDLAITTQANKYDHSAAVNLQHDNTIELRIWSAIDSADDLLLYLDITQALAKYVRTRTIERVQKATLADICKLLTDKCEHIPMIIARLREKKLTRIATSIEKLLNKEGE